MKRIAAIAGLSLLMWESATPIQAQDNFPPPESLQQVRASRLVGKLRVDGRLDERAWQQADPAKGFFRTEPRQGGEVKHPTEVRFLYDDKNLYLGAFCADSMGRRGVRAQDLRRDFNEGENDVFGLALDPQNLKQYAVAFLTTPYGNQRDLQVFNGNQLDQGWNTLWQVRCTRSDTGYYVEMAIPFQSLRYDAVVPGEEVSWGFTLLRFARRAGEKTVFPAIPQAFSAYRMTYAAQLVGLELPPPSANVRIEPYGLYQFEVQQNGRDQSQSQSFKAGGDLKWAIDPRTVVDLTINTDFAQADVDRAVNNLERFNVFFPEQRQFFLENSGLWAGSNQSVLRPFFSRRIGLQGEFDAAPAPIDAGLRYTQRSEQQALAGLYVHQRETDRSRAASFGVLRYQRTYGRENNLGAMLTHRLDENSDRLGLPRQNNSTLTVDGLIRPQSEWTISYLLSASRDHEDQTQGLAGRLFAGNNTNRYYAGWLTTFISEDYNPEMGFVFQRNVVHHSPGGYWIWRPKSLPWIRRWDPGFFANLYHDASRGFGLQQANLYLFPVYLILRDGSFLEYALFPTWQRIDFDFAPLGIPMAQADYFYMRQSVTFNTDQSRKMSVRGSFRWGGFYDGQRQELTLGLRVAPIPYLALSASYGYNRLRGLGIAQQNLDAHLITGVLRLAHNPRLQLSIFYQYNSVDGQGRWNLRGSWEYQPLSFVYLVFNQSDWVDLDRREQALVSKISWVRQF